MWNEIKSKLNNSSGVSILFALYGMMVASLVAAVLVSAALSNVKRAAVTREQNQAYLAAESAEKLVKGMIGDCEINVVKTETTYYERAVGTSERDPKSAEGECSYTVELQSDPNSFSSKVCSMLAEQLEEGESPAGSEFTLNVTDETKQLLPEVTVRLVPEWGSSVDLDYCDLMLNAEIYVSDSNSRYRNPMTVVAVGECREQSSPVIEEGIFEDMEGEKNVGLQRREDTTTYTYSIIWKKNSILTVKGD